MGNSSNIKIGAWGEEIASKHLERKGYKIIDRNFRRKWGEIDIICSKKEDIVPHLRNGQARGTIMEKNRKLKIEKKDRIVPRGTIMEKNRKLENEKKDQNVPRLRNRQARRTIWNKLKSIFSKNKLIVPRRTIQQSSIHAFREKIVFVEVKTMSSNIMRPEEQVTYSKQKRLMRSCQLYLSHKKLPNNIDWQIDVIGIILDKNTGRAKIEHIEKAVYFS